MVIERQRRRDENALRLPPQSPSAFRPRSSTRGAEPGRSRIPGADYVERPTEPYRFLDGSAAAVSDSANRQVGAPTGATAPYAPDLAPNLVPSERAPNEQRDGFVQFLETLTGWLPFVTTDGESLEAYGDRLGDRFGSDIDAAYAWHRERLAGTNRITGTGPSDRQVRDAVRDDFARDLAPRLRAWDPGMSEESARRRAETIVDRMLTRHAHNQDAAEGQATALGVPAPDSEQGRELARRLVPARRTAQRLGGAWPARLQRALQPPPDDDPRIQRLPADIRAQARAMVITGRVELLGRLMAMQNGHGLRTPASTIDTMLDLQARGDIGRDAAVSVISSLERNAPGSRQMLLDRIDSLPADRRRIAYAQLAREHVGMRSTDPAVVGAARTRVFQAVDQLESMSLAEAERALRRGTLGLDGPQMVDIRVGRDTVQIPVYAHPSVSAQDRQRSYDLIQEAYRRVPAPMLRQMLAGEGGEPFAVQLHRGPSLFSDAPDARNPNPERPIGGFFRNDDNQLRLNLDQFDAMSREMGAQRGRAEAMNVIIHESVHLDDDLADSDQGRSYFQAGTTHASEANRTQGQGDLAGAADHYGAIRERHRRLTRDVRSPRGRAYFLLARNPHRTAAQDQRLGEMSRDLAARAGAVSAYAATANPNMRLLGREMAEWWAETLTNYLDPASRDRLRSVDPVAHAAAAHYVALRSQGMSAQEAMPRALRHRLSTAVAGRQGTDLIANAEGSLSSDQLASLDSIADAFDAHASALDGWTPYGNDAGLGAMRRQEAEAGVTSGRALIAQIAQRRQALAADGQGDSTESRRLDGLRQRLERSVATLTQRASALPEAD